MFIKQILQTATIVLLCGQLVVAQVKPAFDKTGMDLSVKPGDDFFMYANGAWIKTAKIPDDQTSWGSFTTLFDENQRNLKKILDEVSSRKNLKKGSLEQQVGDYFASGLDTAAIEKLGYLPLKPRLDRLEKIKSYPELLTFLAEEAKNGGGGSLIRAFVRTDAKKSTTNLVGLSQAGINLPERDYYSRTDSAALKIKAEYLKYITRLFVLTGTSEATAAKQADGILALETEIAKSHSSRIELRNPVKNYNKMSVADLQKLAPNLNWNLLLEKMMMQTDSVNVGQPKYYQELSKLLASQPLDAWKTKVRFDYIAAASAYLSKPFREASFNFNGKTLSGQKTQQPRWKQMISNTDRSLGELLGQLYVRDYFPPAAKARMKELVSNLRTAFRGRIEKLEWMSDATKQKALQKLEAFVPKIGYPDKWENYDDVEISRTSYYQNALGIRQHEYRKMVAKLGKPVDKTEWGMTPPTVNAYYNPTNNEIVFPAGILQFPFFNPDADDAINYGAIGMVIGHEMTHGFDDSGRRFDAEGNLKDWWTKEDAEKFEARANGVVRQYNDFTVLNGVHVKGELTLGENLADFGGLSIAYDAFKITQQGQSTEKIDGFTPDQRFFLGYAQVWRSKVRDERLRVLIDTDPHSPSQFRVNGPLANFEPFYKAFDVKAGDKLYRPETERVRVW